MFNKVLVLGQAAARGTTIPGATFFESEEDGVSFGSCTFARRVPVSAGIFPEPRMVADHRVGVFFGQFTGFLESFHSGSYITVAWAGFAVW